MVIVVVELEVVIRLGNLFIALVIELLLFLEIVILLSRVFVEEVFVIEIPVEPISIVR